MRRICCVISRLFDYLSDRYKSYYQISSLQLHIVDFCFNQITEAI